MEPYYSENGIEIYNGDALEIAPGIDGYSTVITDPPYGIVNEFEEMQGNRGLRSLQFEWDSPEITATVLNVVGSVITNVDSCFVFCGGDQYGALLTAIYSKGFTAKPAIWCKQCPPPAGKGNWWPSAFEFAIYGYNSGAYFSDDDPKRSNVFWYDSYRYGKPGKVDHPTQKPLPLMSRLVLALASSESTVLDPFMGSGTTLLAAKQNGCKAIGIEINDRWRADARRR